MFDFVGMLILEIPNIPNRLRGINTDNIKDKVDTDIIKENIAKIKNDNRIQESISKISRTETTETHRSEKIDEHNAVIDKEIQNEQFSEKFTSEKKEKLFLYLQIMSGAIFSYFNAFYI